MLDVAVSHSFLFLILCRISLLYSTLIFVFIFFHDRYSFFVVNVGLNQKAWELIPKIEKPEWI